MRNVQEYWKCEKCGHMNMDVLCTECGSLRPGVVKVPAVDNTPKPSDNSTTAQGSDKWRCHICGHDNIERFCSVCGQSRENNDKMVVPDQSSFPAFPTMNPNMQPARGMMCDIPQMAPTDPELAEPWFCTNCEHNNKGGEYCFNCGKPNPNATKKDDSWICPDCRASMPGRSAFCHECGKKNPKLTNRAASLMGGVNSVEQWKCIRCGFENISGVYCEKCDAAKPGKNTVFSTSLGTAPTNDINVSTQPAFGGAELPDFITLEQMRRYSNKALRDNPDTCGCYTCCRIFDSSEITVWNGELAVCPYCQSDTVVTKPHNDDPFAELLDKMNRYNVKNERVDHWKKIGTRITEQ